MLQNIIFFHSVIYLNKSNHCQSFQPTERIKLLWGARWANTDAAPKTVAPYVFSGRVGDVLCFGAAWAELLVRWHAACYLDPRTEWVDHIPLRGHTLARAHSHTHAPTSRRGACSLRRRMIVCSRGGEFYMRAAAGVTAFSSESDFNLWNASFVRFSHEKIRKENQRRNMFLYFLCVSFLFNFSCWIQSVLAPYIDCMDCVSRAIYGSARCFNQNCV